MSKIMHFAQAEPPGAKSCTLLFQMVFFCCLYFNEREPMREDKSKDVDHARCAKYVKDFFPAVFDSDLKQAISLLFSCSCFETELKCFYCHAQHAFELGLYYVPINHMSISDSPHSLGTIFNKH